MENSLFKAITSFRGELQDMHNVTCDENLIAGAQQLVKQSTMYCLGKFQESVASVYPPKAGDPPHASRETFDHLYGAVERLSQRAEAEQRHWWFDILEADRDTCTLEVDVKMGILR